MKKYCINIDVNFLMFSNILLIIILKKKPFSELCWNYSIAEINNLNDNIFFYTNNICESFNRSLNSQYIGKTKTIFHFKSAIKNLIEIYNIKNIYQKKKL